MSETAQKEILKMLSDNIITVDEAERLLKALHEGGKQQEESKFRGKKFSWPGSPFEAFGETLSDIGPMIKTTIEDVMSGVFGDELEDLDEEDLKNVESPEGKHTIPDDAQMVIMNDWKCGRNTGDLVLQGVEGNVCHVDGAGATQTQVRQSASHIVLQWGGGPLKVTVPETVTVLKVKTKHGNIRMERIVCDIRVHTIAGNLDMLDVQKDFKAKAMGGNMNLALANAWQGNGRAHAMGGNIFLAIPEDAALKIKAATTGGTVKLDEDIRHVERKQVFHGGTVKAQIGEKETGSSINLKSMGGNIELRMLHEK